ncbi:MAG TPA: type II toxin-antitoxin system PemK/MazF family toxin, partial [Anaerolineae bacterium]
LIVQNNQANRFIPTVTVVPLTSNLRASCFLFTVLLPSVQSGLPQDSGALVFQVRTIDRSRLNRKAGHIDQESIMAVEGALRIHLDL